VPPSPGEAAPDGPPSIGKPITNATVLILDSELKAVQSGEAGELCVAGALVGRGYRGNPQLTAAKFIDHVQPDGTQLRIYRTGDRARFLENGEIAFLGRLDDQVKIRGYRVELGEIIASLDRHLGVEASAVIVRDGDASGPLLVAYVVPAKDARLVAADLRDFLAVRLPDYMIPAHFIAIESLPMTANGKLDKAALPAPSAANLLPMSAGVSNATTSRPQGLEPRIAAIVAALLGQPTVAREDNFFMLGGHSMLGVQLVARIRDAFGVKLTLRQLFSAPTVAALSAEVARLAPGGNA
jgi:acyl-CoA synthetase (AMP-forming)/AMP-acid ligase II/acyl carrier protein